MNFTEEHFQNLQIGKKKRVLGPLLRREAVRPWKKVEQPQQAAASGYTPRLDPETRQGHIHSAMATICDCPLRRARLVGVLVWEVSSLYGWVSGRAGRDERGATAFYKIQGAHCETFYAYIPWRYQIAAARDGSRLCTPVDFHQ